ncbi:hypothetical protein BC937DRAFT_89835 [Endogone sp. FLAS-F59071]|nr:hypothetical protein BC937DRAFT_89835 [Endogone sp. FLAS-F59071]|eukprot:RUS17541.1 hypothetical protein BC937DRAFT_89835 [Endogone sp. FLAS-F59071]
MLPSPPLFSLRFLDPPPSSDSHLLSPKVLSATYDHDAKLRRLAFLQKCFQKRDLWAEVAVLERLYYKNKNQHKQAGYWWRFCEVRRLLSRLKETNLAGMASDLMRGFYGGRPTVGDVSVARSSVVRDESVGRRGAYY